MPRRDRTYIIQPAHLALGNRESVIQVKGEGSGAHDEVCWVWLAHLSLSAGHGERPRLPPLRHVATWVVAHPLWALAVSSMLVALRTPPMINPDTPLSSPSTSASSQLRMSSPQRVVHLSLRWLPRGTNDTYQS